MSVEDKKYKAMTDDMDKSTKKCHYKLTWKSVSIIVNIFLMIIQIVTLILNWNIICQRSIHIWMIVSLLYRIGLLMFQWMFMEPCLHILRNKKAYTSTSSIILWWIIPWVFIIENDILLFAWNIYGTYLLIQVFPDECNFAEFDVQHFDILLFIVMICIIVLIYIIWTLNAIISLSMFLCPAKTNLFCSKICRKRMKQLNGETKDDGNKTNMSDHEFSKMTDVSFRFRDSYYTQGTNDTKSSSSTSVKSKSNKQLTNNKLGQHRYLKSLPSQHEIHFTDLFNEEYANDADPVNDRVSSIHESHHGSTHGNAGSVTSIKTLVTEYKSDKYSHTSLAVQINSDQSMISNILENICSVPSSQLFRNISKSISHTNRPTINDHTTQTITSPKLGSFQPPLTSMVLNSRYMDAASTYGT